MSTNVSARHSLDQLQQASQNRPLAEIVQLYSTLKEQPNTSQEIHNIMLHCLCDHNDLPRILELAETLPEPSISFLDALFTFLVHEKHDYHAHKFYNQLQKSSPDNLAAMPQHVHAKMIRAYGRLKRYNVARSIFDFIVKNYASVDVESLIAVAYAAGLNKPSDLTEVYEEMRRTHLIQDVQTVFSLLNTCFHAQEYALMETVFQESLGDQIKPTTAMYNLLIAGLNKSHANVKALRYWKQLSDSPVAVADRVSYNTVIKIYCEEQQFSRAQDLLDAMEGKGISPDLQTYITFLHFAGKAHHFDVALKLYERAKAQDMPISDLMQGLLSHAVTAKKRDVIMVLLKDLPKVDQSTFRIDVFNQLLEHFERTEQHKVAALLLQRMREGGHKPDDVTYNILLGGAIARGDDARIEAILTEMKQHDIPRTLSIYTNLMDYYGVQKRNLAMVNHLRREMQEKKIKMDSVLCVTVINLYARESQFTAAEHLFKNFLRSKEGKLNAYLLNAMLTTYRRAGMVREATSLFAKFLEQSDEPPTTVTYNILMQIYALKNDFVGVMNYYRKAKDTGANQGTFHAALHAACRCGELQSARDILGEMKKAKIPTTPSLDRLIDKHRL